MYKVAKIIVTSNIEDRDESIYHLEYLLTMLYRNGQIINNWIIEDHINYYEIRVTTTDDDSLNSKYYNQYIKKQLEKFTLEINIISDDASSCDCCHCEEHTYYYIHVNPDDACSPIICGDCGKEIPLIRIPYLYEEEEHFSIINFQSIYTSVDNLWMNSLSDRFSKRQIISYDSQLNKIGQNIREELEKKVEKPVYLLIVNPIGGWYEYKKNNKYFDVCPKCNEKFTFVNPYGDRFCEKCRLAFIGQNKPKN